MASVLRVLIASRASSALSAVDGMGTRTPVSPDLRGTGRQGLLEVGDERTDDLLVVRLARLLAHDHVLHVARAGRPGDRPPAVAEAERPGDGPPHPEAIRGAGAQ